MKYVSNIYRIYSKWLDKVLNMYKAVVDRKKGNKLTVEGESSNNNYDKSPSTGPLT